MKSKGIKCFLVLVAVTVCQCFQCPNRENCRCFELGYHNYGIYCPEKYNVNLFINIDVITITVHCYEKSAWSDLNYYVPDALTLAFTDLVIVNCSWPEVSFAELFGKMNTTDLLSLTFSEGTNETSTLTKPDLSGLRDINGLDLSFNALEELSSNLFEDFTMLKRLNLSSNKINVLPSDIFSLSINLTSIDLSDNNMTWIAEMLFRNLSQLRHLNLMKNRLTSLHPSIFDGLKNLRYLNLARNELSSLSKELLGCLSNLETLDISDNEFSVMDEEIFYHNTKLTSVYLSNNRVNITDSLAFFKFLICLDNVEELRLSGNNLEFLPENFFQNNTRLKELNLSSNAVETLPEKLFEGLGEMEVLDISANQLNDLPLNIFFPLVNLKELNLQSNKLTTLYPIPASVEILNANYNQIAPVASNIHILEFFHHKLRVLRLSHNLVDKSGINRFFLERWLPAYCTDIEEIYLDHNKIVYFQYQTLKDLSHLKLLDLSYNQLTEIQIAHSFHKTESATIDVTHNAIGKFEVAPIARTCAQRKVNAVDKSLIRAGDNPVVCDCELYDLLRIVDGRSDSNSKWCVRIDTDNLKCSNPGWLRGMPVANFTSKDFVCRRKIDYSECPLDCECWWRTNDNTRLLNCSHRNLTEAPRLFHGTTSGPIELNLNGNCLTKLPSLNGSGYELVTKLFLSHNVISNVSFDVVSPNLKILQLEHNNLTSFDARTMNAIKHAKNLDNLTLFDNPWDCNRVTRRFFEYVSRTFSTRTTVSPKKLCLDEPRDERSFHRPRPRITVVRF